MIPNRGVVVYRKDDPTDRFNDPSCNTHECIGDEICIAKQDLVIAIDGSGFLCTTGSDIIRDFAAEQNDRFKSENYANAAMKSGVVMFGNGEVLDDGTVLCAIKVASVTVDRDEVKTSIEGLKRQHKKR